MDNKPGRRYIVTDDNGQPIGVFDKDLITDRGTELAFAMAAVCDDPEAIRRVGAETMSRVGVDAFGYVAACALTAMAEHILGPSFAVAKAHGTDLQAGMRDIANGRDPLANG